MSRLTIEKVYTQILTGRDTAFQHITQQANQEIFSIRKNIFLFFAQLLAIPAVAKDEKLVALVSTLSTGIDRNIPFADLPAFANGELDQGNLDALSQHLQPQQIQTLLELVASGKLALPKNGIHALESKEFPTSILNWLTVNTVNAIYHGQRIQVVRLPLMLVLFNQVTQQSARNYIYGALNALGKRDSLLKSSQIEIDEAEDTSVRGTFLPIDIATLILTEAFKQGKLDETLLQKQTPLTPAELAQLQIERDQSAQRRISSRTAAESPPFEFEPLQRDQIEMWLLLHPSTTFDYTRDQYFVRISSLEGLVNAESALTASTKHTPKTLIQQIIADLGITDKQLKGHVIGTGGESREELFVDFSYGMTIAKEVVRQGHLNRGNASAYPEYLASFRRELRIKNLQYYEIMLLSWLAQNGIVEQRQVEGQNITQYAITLKNVRQVIHHRDHDHQEKSMWLDTQISNFRQSRPDEVLDNLDHPNKTLIRIEIFFDLLVKVINDPEMKLVDPNVN